MNIGWLVQISKTKLIIFLILSLFPLYLILIHYNLVPWSEFIGGIGLLIFFPVQLIRIILCFTPFFWDGDYCLLSVASDTFAIYFFVERLLEIVWAFILSSLISRYIEKRS